MSAHKAAKALRRFCLECQGGHPPAVAACKDAACPLFAFRQCTTTALSEEARPLRAVRLHCLACAGSRQEVRHCTAKPDCPLWSYRFGILPATFRRVVARRRAKQETLLLPGFNPAPRKTK